MREEVMDASMHALMALRRWEREGTEAARAEYDSARAALKSLANANRVRTSSDTKPRHLHLVWSRPG